MEYNLKNYESLCCTILYVIGVHQLYFNKKPIKRVWNVSFTEFKNMMMEHNDSSKQYMKPSK